MSQFVGRADDKGFKGKFGVSEAFRLLFRSGAALKLQEASIVQNFNIKIRGENVMKGRLDIIQKKGFEVSPFEVAGAMQKAYAASDVHNGELVKPGGNSRFGKRAPKLAQDIFPDVGNRIQKGNTSLFYLNGY